MNLKLSRTAIRELSKRYRAVLMAAFAASAFATGGAQATVSIDTTSLTVDLTTGSSAQPVSGKATISGLGTMAEADADDYYTSAQVDAKGYQTATQVGTAITAALGDYTKTSDLVNGYVAKETGKGLSTNDFTTAEKEKLAGLSNYDDTDLTGRVTALEGAGYQTASDVTSAINAAKATSLTDTSSEKLATEGLVVSALNGKTSLTDVINDAGSTASGHLGEAIINATTSDATNTGTGHLGAAVLTTVVNDAGNTTSGHLGAAIKATKVDSAASADAVTSSAVDNSTIVLSGGKLSVGEIAQGKVTGLTTALGNISVSTSSGVVTVQDDEGHNANVYDTTTVDTKTTVATQATSTAGYGANTAVTTAVTNLDTALGHAESGMENLAAQLGVTYTKSTGAVTSTNYSSENFITDGDTVVGAIGKLDGAIGGTITGSGFLNGTEVGSGTGKSSVKDVLQSVSDTIGTVDFSSGKNTTATDLTTAIKDLDTEIGADADYGTTPTNGISASASVKTNVAQVSSALSAITGGSISGTTVQNDYMAGVTGINYNPLTDDSTTPLASAIGQINKNIGTAIASVATRSTGALSGTATVNDNLKALDTAIGDNVTSTLNILAANSVNANISSLDAALGDVSTVAVNGYTAGTKNLVAAVNQLDTNMETVLGGIYKSDGKYDQTAIQGTNGFDNKATSNSLTAALKSYADNVQAATGTTFAADGSFTNSFSKPSTTDYDGLATDQSLVSAISQLDANIGTAMTATGSGRTTSTFQTAITKTVNQNLSALDAAIGADMSATGSGRTTTTFQTGAGKSVNANLSALDAAIGADMTAIGTGRTTAAFQTGAGKSVNANLTALDATIGADVTTIAATTVKTASGDNNGVNASNTINQNISALNAAVGDISTLAAGTAATGDAITKGTGTVAKTVVEAINNIDATLGNIHDLYDGSTVNASAVTSTVNGHSNLAKGTTVEDHLVSVDNAIGDRAQYANARYVNPSMSNADAIMTLDTNLHLTEQRVRRVEKEMRGGFASVAALSALVPNARASGDTQISVGTGAYRDHAGLAVGAFHYFNDNVLANVGASYGGDKSTVIRAGVTFGW